MEADITMTVEEEPVVNMTYVEGKLKPEVVGQVTPAYEPQRVTPPAGSVFSAVEVGAIPEPTETETYTENGTYNVSRIGTAVIQVPQGVFPAGTLQITANGPYDVKSYETADINVPVEWVSPSGQARLVTQRVTLQEDFSGQATAFIPIITALAGIDANHQDVVINTLAMVSEPQTPATNEIRELAIGYTAGLRYKRIYWNGSKWVATIVTNTYFNVVAKAGSVYELVGIEMRRRASE